MRTSVTPKEGVSQTVGRSPEVLMGSRDFLSKVYLVPRRLVSETVFGRIESDITTKVVSEERSVQQKKRGEIRHRTDLYALRGTGVRTPTSCYPNH